MDRISVRSMLAEVLLYTYYVFHSIDDQRHYPKDLAGEGGFVSNRSTCSRRGRTVKVEARWIHTTVWDGSYLQ
jgi:hypothetical protein